jgi:hypothetical protein
MTLLMRHASFLSGQSVMATKVVEGVLYSMINEVMCCGVIVQVGPGTEERVRPDLPWQRPPASDQK